MKILVAPNAMKGSLTASEAARIISLELANAPQAIETIICPIADGGNGTLDSILSNLGGTVIPASVHDPLQRLIISRWGLLDDGTAIIEMAEASGLLLLNPDEYDPEHTTTRGVGELIVSALQKGVSKIIVGLGGSATNDGGSGCARALGVRFLDELDNPLPEGGIFLRQLAKIDVSGIQPDLHHCEIIALTDVDSPLYGAAGASRTFARQKGASEEQIDRLDQSLQHYSDIIFHELGIDVSVQPGGGAAGGLGAGLLAFAHAKIVSGIDFLLDLLRIDQLLLEADAVITTEGSLDEQTLHGKGIAGLAQRAKKMGKPVHVFAGRVCGDIRRLRDELRLSSIHQITPDGLSTQEAISRADALLRFSIAEFAASSPKKLDTNSEVNQEP